MIGPVPTYGVSHALRSLSCNLKSYTLQLLSSVYKKYIDWNYDITGCKYCSPLSLNLYNRIFFVSPHKQYLDKNKNRIVTLYKKMNNFVNDTVVSLLQEYMGIDIWIYNGFESLRNIMIGPVPTYSVSHALKPEKLCCVIIRHINNQL